MNTLEKKYLTHSDVSLRLNESLLRWKGKWFYARYEDGERKVSITLYDLVTGKTVETVDPNSPNLDVSSPQLGYAEPENWRSPVFIQRSPYRRQKQGAGSDNMIYSVNGSGHRGPVPTSWLFTKAFKSMLEGVYPPYMGLVESLNKHFTKKSFDEIYAGRAVSRNFCLFSEAGKKNIICYNCATIGTFDIETGVVTLSPLYNNSLFINKLQRLGVPLSA
jgi:hypothetical protein